MYTHVIGEHRISKQPFDGGRENGDARRVLPLNGKRPTVRERERRIPEPAQPVQEAVGVPRQNRGQNDRVAEAAGNRAHGVPQQRIGGGERRHEKEGDAARVADGSSAHRVLNHVGLLVACH